MTAARQDRLARAAAALRPYLLRYADYELETLARVVLDAAAEPAGQDGERLITTDMVAEAVEAQFQAQDRRVVTLRQAPSTIRAALAAVALDLDRAGYDRARRECADELRALADQVGQEKVRHRGGYLTVSPLLAGVLDALADRWSSSGRAPAGEEEQR